MPTLRWSYLLTGTRYPLRPGVTFYFEGLASLLSGLEAPSAVLWLCGLDVAHGEEREGVCPSGIVRVPIANGFPYAIAYIAYKVTRNSSSWFQ